MPERWMYTEGPALPLPTDDAWWHSFGDPMLDSLISLGVANNYDVLGAQRRVEMARQGVRRAQSQYYPSVGLSGSWAKQRTSGATTSTLIDASTLSMFDLGANMQWQIDIFGKISAQARQSKEQYHASAAQYDAMMVTISAKIATAYMQLRTLQAQLDVLDKHIAQQKRVADITSARHEAGLASMLDVSQALTTYYSTQATITSVKTSIATTINTLCVLTGTFPNELAPQLSASA